MASMTEDYKQFDKSPIVDPSDVVFKGFHFRIREVVLGGALVLCLVIIIILAAVLGAAKSKGSDTQSPGTAQGQVAGPEGECFSPPCLKTAAYVTELINASADPCNDFHSFACGHFPELHPLVPFESEMTTFQLVYDKNQERLRRLLEQQQDPSTVNTLSWERKLRDFFFTCQDQFSKMQQQGGPFLEHIVQVSGGWWALVGDQGWGAGYNFQRQLELVHVDMWTDAFFTFNLITDWLDWNILTIQIDLSGLGMPYSYYINPPQPSFVEDYKKYIRTVGGLLLRDAGLDISDVEKLHRLDTFVTDVFYVESEMAQLKNMSESTANPHALDKRLKLTDLNAMSSGAVDWVSLFKYMFNTSTVTGDTYVVVLEQEYVLRFTKWISLLPAANKSRILNNYLIWRLADHYDQDLSWDYIHANRQIFVDLTGEVDFLGSWRYCLYKVDQDMKEALGALFITNHFSEDNKRMAHKITDFVKQALLEGLRKSTWMSEETKELALKKIEDSIMELGYPDYMTNNEELDMLYAKLDIGPDYLKNVLSFNAFYRASWNHAFSNPNDRTHWPYAVYDFVAHYYSPWKRLFLPAGILQFPLYDHTSPNYANFGSMGTIVGRQLTHAVDEFGNSYSLTGSGLGQWWSNETSQRYLSIRSCIVQALNKTTFGPYLSPVGLVRVRLNASYYAPLALGESSSVKLAYMAYNSWANTAGGEKVMPGGKYTNDQMFFIAYAQTYCRTRDPSREFYRIYNGKTPTDKLRVNAALAHVPEFQKAFQCPDSSFMVAPKRCSFF